MYFKDIRGLQMQGVFLYQEYSIDYKDQILSVGKMIEFNIEDVSYEDHMVIVRNNI